METLKPHPNLPTLYWANGSIPSWQILFLLYEREIEFHPHRLRLMSRRETKTSAFLTLNPRGETPTWVEPDGRVLYESKALLFYLNLRDPGPDLTQRHDLLQYGLILQRIFELEALRRAYRPLEQLFKQETASETLLSQAYHAPAKVREELDFWESTVLTGSHIVGETFTLADCCFYPTLAYQMHRGLTLEGFPKIAAYMRRMSQRSAAQRAHPLGWEKPAKINLFRRAAALSLP